MLIICSCEILVLYKYTIFNPGTSILYDPLTKSMSLQKHICFFMLCSFLVCVFFCKRDIWIHLLTMQHCFSFSLRKFQRAHGSQDFSRRDCVDQLCVWYIIKNESEVSRILQLTNFYWLTFSLSPCGVSSQRLLEALEGWTKILWTKVELL